MQSSADLLWSILPDDVSALQIISFDEAQILSNKSQIRNEKNALISNFIKQVEVMETRSGISIRKEFSAIVSSMGAVAINGNATSSLENNSLALFQLKDQKNH